MIEELYVNGVLVDLGEANIRRIYTSPFFGDISKISNNSTYTINLPFTEKNKCVFGYSNRIDSSSIVPYKYLSSTYYKNNKCYFKDAKTILISSASYFEIQIVWGVSQPAIDSLNEKLNELQYDGINVKESDWIVEWDNVHMYASNKMYSYLDYISAYRERDVYVVDGFIQPKIPLPQFWVGHDKTSTLHPFISFKNLIDLAKVTTTKSYQFTCIGFHVDMDLPEYNYYIEIVESNIGKISTYSYLSYLNDDKMPDRSILLYYPNDDSYNLPNRIYVNKDISSLNIKQGDIISIKTSESIFDLSEINSRLSKKGIILAGKKDNLSFDETFPAITSYYGVSRIKIKEGSSQFKHVQVSQWYILNNFTYEKDTDFTVTINLEIKRSGTDDFPSSVGLALYCKYTNEDSSETEELIGLFAKGDLRSDGYHLFSGSVKGTMQVDRRTFYIKFTLGAYSFDVKSTGFVNLKFKIDEALYSTWEDGASDIYRYGRFNTILNLPELKKIDLIKNLSSITGVAIGFDFNGNITEHTLEKVSENINAGIYYDWTNKLSNIEKIEYKYGSYCKNNYFEAGNESDLDYVSKGNLKIFNETLQADNTLYKSCFNLPERYNSDGMIEFIQYNQKVESKTIDSVEVSSFSSDFNAKEPVMVYDMNGIASIKDCQFSDGVKIRKITDVANVAGASTPSYFKEVNIISISEDKKTITVNNDYWFQSILDLGDPVYFYRIGNVDTCIGNVEVIGRNLDNHTITLSNEIDIDSSVLGFCARGEIINEFSYANFNENNLDISIGDQITDIILYSQEDDVFISLHPSNLYITSINESLKTATLNFDILRKGVNHALTIEEYSHGFIGKYYGIHQKILNRPFLIKATVNESEINLTDIDFEKPCLIDDGIYGLIMELESGADDLCDATILLIKQKI